MSDQGLTGFSEVLVVIRSLMYRKLELRSEMDDVTRYGGVKFHFFCFFLSSPRFRFPRAVM